MTVTDVDGARIHMQVVEIARQDRPSLYDSFADRPHPLVEREHRFGHDGDHKALLADLAVADPEVDLVAYEKRKIKGAIRTDFILSAEIIVIALGTVQGATLATRIGVLSAIAVLMTIGVYGLVAGIVKLDDAGLYLAGREGESLTRRGLRAVGRFLLRLAPWLMKSLAVLGTAAMFLVGGGILVHGLPPVYELLHHLQELALGVGAMGGLLSGLVMVLFNGLFGILAGGLVLGVVSLALRLRRAFP